ncbi:MAG: hypothetical protein G8345_11125 [Magnetococcales bacterium]|nr:DegT/DnrJ/EryC1/StrS family aminotransferase [Magnetococcales bacterium]NGZ27425.1 hypothetical protein [Magnetococcales bacterium]
MASLPPIPLWRPELMGTDQSGDWGEDAGLLTAWEEAWSQRWQRSAIAFAHPLDFWQSLRQVMGWPVGKEIGLDPFLHPIWRESLAAAGWVVHWRDWLETEGLPAGSIHFCHHPFGLPGVAASDWVVEEISSILLPRQGCGQGQIQIAGMQGMIQAGQSVMALCGDGQLADALRQTRRQPPGALLCRLGLNQWQRLAEVLEKRRALAERYDRLLRCPSVIRKPQGERVWEWYILECASQEIRNSLQEWFHRSAIATASPLWFTLPDHLPEAHRFHATALALPLYAPLSDSEQKRIINRFHRWQVKTYQG